MVGDVEVGDLGFVFVVIVRIGSEVGVEIVV